MLVAFWRWWKFLQHLSTKDNEEIFVKIRWHWKLRLGVESASADYANELLVRYETFLSNSQTRRNNTKLSKTGFGYGLSNVWETHKLTRFHKRLESFLTLFFLENKCKRLRAQLARYSSQRKIKKSLVFDTEKLTFLYY